ncbi:MAG TPA: DnaB-like helicase N-terminal domain-containing protein, partial [Candidatus Binataceae bacterium]|nr:DnaB-like helicase N-terminal domain-containing protein [Candidatus Binataceae bacterium]
MAAAASEDILRRVPPQNIEAEQSVLGAILLDNDAINQALEIVTAEDFYRESHREIFRAMVALIEHLQPVDAITLTDALRTRGVLEAIGGAAYIAELAAGVPTAANVAHYARIVREKAVLRGLASVATEIASDAYDSPTNVDEFLDESEHKIFEISERRIRQSFHSMNELTRESLKLIEQLYEKKELVTGVPTGFLDLDRLTAGLQPADR